ncbi:MAG: hypothetical protein KDA22_05960 [Phycisphaerales bacterium]|nr:hypothetical protein [Phycisphaerales bacterium]
MPQETKSITPLASPETFAQGTSVDAGNPEMLAEALHKALEYRGDVTLHLRTSDAPVEGYIFDLQGERTPTVRLLPKDADERRTIVFRDIARLEVTGKDTAAGKSFENWVKRYVQKKLAGETASIESEPL